MKFSMVVGNSIEAWDPFFKNPILPAKSKMAATY
jgi:hypothetical protein